MVNSTAAAVVSSAADAACFTPMPSNCIGSVTSAYVLKSSKKLPPATQGGLLLPVTSLGLHVFRTVFTWIPWVLADVLRLT